MKFQFGKRQPSKNPVQTRKQLRKELRKTKKQNRRLHYLSCSKKGRKRLQKELENKNKEEKLNIEDKFNHKNKGNRFKQKKNPDKTTVPYKPVPGSILKRKHESDEEDSEEEPPMLVEIQDRKKVTFKDSAEDGESKIVTSKLSANDKLEKERMKMKREKDSLDKQIQKRRVELLKEDNEKEDQEIKKLEKQLKLSKNNRKARSFFAVDGLDYVLDICDRNKSKKKVHDSDSEFENDLAEIGGKGKSKDGKSGQELSPWKVKDDDDNDNDSSQSEMDDSDQEMHESSEISDEENVTKSSKKKTNQSVQKTSSKKAKSELESESNDDGSDISEEQDNSDEGGAEESLDEEEGSKGDSEEQESETENNNNEEDEGDNTEDEAEDEANVESDENVQDDSSDKDEDSKTNLKEKKFSKNKETGNKDEVWEDIYGRLRDKKGNVVNAYKPPHLRKAAESLGKNEEKLQQLKRQLKGLLNRLTGSNMAGISSEIEQLYMSNSRNDMNETLTQLYFESLVSETEIPERLIIEHALLIAILNANVGIEVGAYVLQNMVTEFDKMLKENVAVHDKRINNVLLLIVHLYNCRVFSSQLIFDIINELMKELEEKPLELLILMLRTVGFVLRKDDPLGLKSLVVKAQEKVKAVASEDHSSRVKFMLDIILAIKNNNMSKIPNYNPDIIDEIKKKLKILIKSGSADNNFNVSLRDLLHADERGRWWVVGSAWSGEGPNDSRKDKSSEEASNLSFSKKLLDLAKKQRMNTDVRRTVFCILMAAEDCEDAFQKLLRLRLKGNNEREIINVIIHCSLQEKEFNPYYSYLANKFCHCNRKYQIMFQYALWDRIKELESLLPLQVTNLASFIGNLVLEKGLPLSVIKVIEFAEMNTTYVKFIRQILLTLFLSDRKDDVHAAFAKVMKSNDLKVFREGIRLFLHHFMLRNMKNIETESGSDLKNMIHFADSILSGTESDLILQ